VRRSEPCGDLISEGGVRPRGRRRVCYRSSLLTDDLVGECQRAFCGSDLTEANPRSETEVSLFDRQSLCVGATSPALDRSSPASTRGKSASRCRKVSVPGEYL